MDKRDGATVTPTDALRDLLQFFKQDGEDSLDQFERIAAWFNRETGYLRPGKDCPVHDPEVREEAWGVWVAKKLNAARAALAAAEKDESELVAALREMKELFRFALTCTSPEIAREGMAFVRKAESILAKHAKKE